MESHCLRPSGETYVLGVLGVTAGKGNVGRVDPDPLRDLGSDKTLSPSGFTHSSGVLGTDPPSPGA